MSIQDIVLETRSLCDATSVSYTDATLLRRLNAAYETIVARLLQNDGTFQFDDSNYTTFPIGVATLVASQNDYSFDSTHLFIERVEVKDVNGIWHLLSTVDTSTIGEAMDEFEKTDGLPYCYDKKGSSLLLYPAPAAADCTLASGLKVYFQRTASIFTSAEVTTGTKVPGFASPFHTILCYMAALPYCQSYKKDRVALYEKKVMDMEKDLLKFYAKREKDTRDILSTSGVAFK